MKLSLSATFRIATLFPSCFSLQYLIIIDLLYSYWVTVFFCQNVCSTMAGICFVYHLILSTWNRAWYKVGTKWVNEWCWSWALPVIFPQKYFYLWSGLWVDYYRSIEEISMTTDTLVINLSSYLMRREYVYWGKRVYTNHQPSWLAYIDVVTF